VAVALALTVRLSRAAAADLDALHRRARGMLAIQLLTLARERPHGGLFVVYAAWHGAACEALEDRGVLLVHTVDRWMDLVRLVLGPELDRRHRQREALALMHGRR
jgi:hypothetical protein